MDQGRGEGRGQGPSRKMFCDPWESLAHGHWWFYQWESLYSLIHVDQRPLIWEVRNFLLDDFSNSDLEVNKLASSSLATFRLLLKLKVPRILEVRGVIASNYVSEFHSKLKAFIKWKTQPKFLSSQSETMGGTV